MAAPGAPPHSNSHSMFHPLTGKTLVPRSRFRVAVAESSMPPPSSSNLSPNTLGRGIEDSATATRNPERVWAIIPSVARRRSGRTLELPPHRHRARRHLDLLQHVGSLHIPGQTRLACLIAILTCPVLAHTA